MKCFYHNEIDAVAQCIDCGKGLCKECATKFSIPICPECNLKRIQNDKKLLLKNTVVMVIAFIIGFYACGPEATVGFKIMMGYICAGIPWGWSVLTKIKPDIFLFLPLVGWIIYILIKLTISLYIGVFIAPYKIYKTVRGVIKAKKDTIYCKQVILTNGHIND